MLGRHLSIRATAYVAGEPVPFFWPIRSFIAHNPLHGLEHLPFAEATAEGSKLFQANSFLPRRVYQGYLADGSLDRRELRAQIEAFATSCEPVPGIDFVRLATTLVESVADPIVPRNPLADIDQLHNALHGRPADVGPPASADFLKSHLRDVLLGDRPVYEAVDALFATGIGEQLDELVIRACLDFFDEGQSVWVMPDREKGFFAAWRQVAGHRARRLLDEVEAAQDDIGKELAPEQVIDHILRALKVPEHHRTGYFTREIVRLHGWAGFIRWRASAKRYYWARHFPGDLVDLLAVRLTLGFLLLEERGRERQLRTVDDIAKMIERRPQETWLRLEMNSGDLLPSKAKQIETCLARGDVSAIRHAFKDYLGAKRLDEAGRFAAALGNLAKRSGQETALNALGATELASLVACLRALEAAEGMFWLRALEMKAMRDLLSGISRKPAVAREKRPFVQAAFCIDTRSERFRRHLESVGDYQTFGIAGFFGVPVSLIELGKGSEQHLCPVLLTPKNLVLEMSSAVWTDEAALTTLGHAMHELKESVFSPFVTVEAIGLLFGFDMIGKTVLPQAYGKWRKRLHNDKPKTHLLLDKLSREQADSIVRAVQRAVIVAAVEQELGLQPEAVTDDTVRLLREAALGKAELGQDFSDGLGVEEARLRNLETRLSSVYRINPSFAQLQLEQLGRIGFSIDEQVTYVQQALSSIGLTSDFSRFVLLVGHGSTSENNPYESALDCGACGGSHGLISARVLAQMANKYAVRRRLAEKGIAIPDDAWFVPALHNTTTDEITLHDLELLPTTHLVYLDRLRTGLTSAARLCAQERLPSLEIGTDQRDPAAAFRGTRRNALDWSQVRPEWGLARNAFFVIGQRTLTQSLRLDGRAFLHSYDYRLDTRWRLLENILSGPLVVAQWINMQYYFSGVDNERFGSGSKVYHNVAGRFGVMTGNLSDMRTGLPAQTVLNKGALYHQPIRLITLIEAPYEPAFAAIERVAAVKRLVRNGWIRLAIVDPETGSTHVFDETAWIEYSSPQTLQEELAAS